MGKGSVKNALVVTDLHLTSAVRDAYRFKVFRQLHAEIEKREVSSVWILGDLTDAKDNHASVLVNKIVTEIVGLSRRAEVKIVRGNHDGLDPAWPYFGFLSHLDKVTFYAKPEVVREVLILPHSRSPAVEWKRYKFQDFACIVMHATVDGSVVENDTVMTSEVSSAWFKSATCPIYSGDVHVPQRVGKITYIGAPYPIRYGDKFPPRMLYLDSRMRETFIPLENIRRFLADIRSPDELEKLDARKGDQIKVRVHVREADLGKWAKLRREVTATCENAGLDVAGVELACERSQRASLKAKTVAGLTPEAVFGKYVDRHRLPEAVVQIGLELLKAQNTRSDT